VCFQPFTILTMVGPVTKVPTKRALAEASNNRVNASPRSAKKLKTENGDTTRGPPVKKVNGPFNSSQLGPSQFENTLEQMTQDIEALKTKNTEKDQQWKRPPLPEGFSEMTSKVVFQQIEAEESVLNGGKPAVKLFGVTEVCRVVSPR
jgi:DNA polymerase delta subunit 1